MQTTDYLALSQLAYSQFIDKDVGRNLGDIIDKAKSSDSAHHREGLNPDDSTLAALTDPSNPLRSWRIIAQSPPTTISTIKYRQGEFTHTVEVPFSATAFQNPKTGEIVFAFRGTNNTGDWATDLQIALGHPELSVKQFQLAKQFVYNTLNKHGQVYCYIDQDDMFASLNQNSNVSFTGHSLGGGLAQYMTYITANLDNGDTGVKSVTFNAVGVGQNLENIDSVEDRLASFNSVDHVNSLDWVGIHGVQIGRTERHIDKSEVNYSGVNFDVLGKMLATRLRLSQGNISLLEYKQRIDHLKAAITNGSDGYSVHDTMSIYQGYEGAGGTGGSRGMFLATPRHNLDRFLIDDPSASGSRYVMTSLVDDQQEPARNLNELFNLINAFQVIERAKIDGNYTADVVREKPLGVYAHDNIDYYRLVMLPDGSVSTNSYTYEQIAYANYIIQQFERSISNGSFTEIIESYNQATTAARVDPLIFDLNGDSVFTTSLANSRTYFDLDANGYAERTAWVDKNDGLLVLDRNDDGKITNGQELFGDQTILINGTRAASGFQALAEFDGNNDGRIDARDVVYAKLKIWQDINQDGVSQTEELKSLADINITVVNLNSTVIGATDVMGNIQRCLGNFVKSDNSVGQVGEYLLNRDPLDSRDLLNGGIVISDEIAALPEVQGSGNVSSLRTAMAKDESGRLKELVAEFVVEEDTDVRRQLFTEILYKWTGADVVNPNSRGGLVDARELTVLEKFMGTSFVGVNGANPNNIAAPLLKKAFSNLANQLYASIMSVTHLKGLVDKIECTFDEKGLVVDFSNVKDEVNRALEIDFAKGKRLLSDFSGLVYANGLGRDEGFMAFRNHFASKSPKLARVVYAADINAIIGSENQDSLNGTTEDNTLYGDSGNDALYGQAGNDTLAGGADNDQLYGGEGNDVYIFNKGDGVDVVTETNGVDTIQFGEGIAPEDIVAKVVRDSNNSRVNLELSIKGTNDKITVYQHFGNAWNGYQETPTYQIEKVIFANGTIWDLQTIHDKAHDMSGTDNAEQFYIHDKYTSAITFNGLGGNDAVYGGLADDLLRGGNDNDTLYGQVGNDLLYGDSGSDTLYGQAGDDTLAGGTDNDQLYGGEGNDVYIFNKGDGVDVVTETNGVDTIQFGEGISPEDIVVKLVNTRSNEVSLEIIIKDTDDKIIINQHGGLRYYSSPHVATPQYQVERIVFADRTIWDLAEIHRWAHNVVGTDKNESWSALDDASFMCHGLDGNDTINGGVAEDHLYGDAGDDNIYGNKGNDVLSGGTGNDLLYGNAGNDVYLFNRGDGTDAISEEEGFDTVRFGKDIKPNDVVIRAKEGSDKTIDLELSIKDTDDKLIVKQNFGIYSYYQPDILMPYRQVEKIEFTDGTFWDVNEIYRRAHDLAGTDGADNVCAIGSTDFSLYGEGGNDAVNGARGNDALYGGDGDDTLSGNEGNDLYVGGQGDDTMHDYRGDDVYIFNRGDGKDYISDPEGVNVLRFGAGISPEDIIVERNIRNNDYNLDLKIKNSEDAVTVRGYFGYYSNWSGSVYLKGKGMDKIEFADGTVWTPDVIYDTVHKRTGTEEDDTINAYDDGSVIYHGLGGNDKLTGSKGSDQLYGGDGNDVLNGNEGDDLFVGGKGDDRIDSYKGDDIYIFNPGDGVDIISDYGGFDKLKFGEGIAPGDVILKRFMSNYSAHMEISFKNSTDKLIIERYFGSGNYNGFSETDQYKMDEIIFADGTVWTNDIIYEKMHNITGTDETDRVYAYDGGDVVYRGLGGDDYLAGGKGNDELYGGDGNDQLAGNEGSDSFFGDRGDDTISDTNGDETYTFNLGDGRDTIYDYKGVDILRFGKDISPDDIVIRRFMNGYNADMELSIKGTSDAIVVRNYFGTGSVWGFSETKDYQIEKMTFADGTVWTQDTIYQKMHNIIGSNEKDNIVAYDSGDVVYRGLGDDDRLTSGIGNDLLYGDSGSDTLYGQAGDDTLAGGTDNDQLYGGEGNDVYIFNKGDGVDVVYDASGLADEIRLDHESTSVIFERINHDLRIRMPGSIDAITVNSWYRGENYKIETFTSNDGHIITHTQIDSLIQAMSSFQADSGMTWEQALSTQPSQVRSIIQEYWTAPTA